MSINMFRANTKNQNQTIKPTYKSKFSLKYKKEKKQRNKKEASIISYSYMSIDVSSFFQFINLTNNFSKGGFASLKNNFLISKDESQINIPITNLIRIFKFFQKSINFKNKFRNNSHQTIKLDIHEQKSICYSNNQKDHQIKRNKSKQKKKQPLYNDQSQYNLFFDERFNLNNNLRRHIIFIESIIKLKKEITTINLYQIYISAKCALKHFKLYKLFNPDDKMINKRLIRDLHQNSINKIEEILKKRNYKYIDHIFKKKDDFREILLEVNFFVMKYSSFKSDLKQNLYILIPKLTKIIQKVPEDDEIIQLILKSFENIKKFNHSKVKFTRDENKSLAINVNSVLKVINIFFDFMLNDQIKPQCKIIEKKLFKVIFHPTNDDSYRTNIFSVYNIHDDFIYSKSPFLSLSSSTGSGKTRCAPFLLSIKSIEEGMNYPFIIMTQPRYSIIKTKIDDFKSVFGNSIMVVTDLKRMFKLYEKYARKDIDFHPKFYRPILGIFTAQTVLELMKMTEKIQFDICTVTRFCLDEIHERTVEADVLCGVLSKRTKEMIEQKEEFPLQLLLMSATPDFRVFKCFDEIENYKLPESTLFPVKIIRHEIENREKINSVTVSEMAKIIQQMADCQIEKGDILVFTSGHFRMKGIEKKLFDKIERKCFSYSYAVKVIDNFECLFQDENIDQFYNNLDKLIECETKKFSMIKYKGQDILFVLPIKYLGYLSKEQKEICINPIPKHSNVIKVILATNAIESSITISNLAAVIDSGVYNNWAYNELTGATSLTEEPISIQSQIQRKGRVGRLRDGILVKISLKNQKTHHLLPPMIQTSDVSYNILMLKKIGYKIEEIENLPDKIDESKLENYIKDLVSYNALTNETYELTKLGTTLVKFNIISPFISAAILSVAGYKNDNYDSLNSVNAEDEEIPQKESLVLLGCFITLIFSSSEFVINAFSTKLKEYFDKRSDIITLLRTLLDLAQFSKKEMKDKEDEYGLDIRLVIKIFSQLQQIAENVIFSIIPKEDERKLKPDQREKKRKEDENRKELIWKLIFKSLKNLVDNLITDDFLYVFIEMLIEEISKNKPEWIDSRRVQFENIENASSDPILIYQGDYTFSFYQKENVSFINLKKRPGGIGLDSPAKGIIFSIMHDCNARKNYGWIIHSDYVDEESDFIPQPVSVKCSSVLFNMFTIPLLEAYFSNDNESIQPFYPSRMKSLQLNHRVFLMHESLLVDSDKKEYSVISFIPKTFDIIGEFEKAVDLIGKLLPYTASTVLIHHPELKCFVSLNGNGSTRIDSSVYFYETDDKCHPYMLNRETIKYLCDSIEELKQKKSTLEIALTGEYISYPLDNSKDDFYSGEITTNTQEKYVFFNNYTFPSHLFLLSKQRIVDFDNKGYLLSWAEPKKEVEEINKKEKEIFDKVIQIGDEAITICFSFVRLIFTMKESILQAKGRVPPQYGTEDIPFNLSPLEQIFYMCALNHIEEEKLTSPLKFRGFYYRGKPFPYIPEICTIKDARFTYLGNSCVTLDVSNYSIIPNITDFMYQTFSNYDPYWRIYLEFVPVYEIEIIHTANSNLTKKEFIERIDSVIDQFGGIIVEKSEYKQINSKYNLHRGFIKVLFYCIDFAVPLVSMIKEVLQQNPIDPFVDVLQNTIDPILIKDKKIQSTLCDWFSENKVEYNSDKIQLIGEEENIRQAISKFKKDPPRLPYKSFNISYKIDINQLQKSINYINKYRQNKWYLNEYSRVLFTPLEIEEDEVNELFGQFENVSKNSEDDDNILHELYLHEDEPSLSKKLIPIFSENGEIVHKEFCVDCLHDTFLYNLRKMYKEEDDSCSLKQVYNDIGPLRNIALIDCNLPEFSQRIPLGQMILGFIDEEKVANQTRTWITALAVRSLRRSKKITSCPNHPHILLQQQSCVSVNCSVLSCKFVYCIKCHKWHEFGNCEKCGKEMDLLPGTRICPCCLESVEKSQSCNHIHCHCGKDFCYYCGEGFEDSNSCYNHMNDKKHWEEAPDYRKFIIGEKVTNEKLIEFYEKYPKLKPSWFDDEIEMAKVSDDDDEIEN